MKHKINGALAGRYGIDFGRFPDSKSDFYVKVSEELWTYYLSSRFSFEQALSEMETLKRYRIKKSSKNANKLKPKREV